jgi:O-succinylbenzoate synthase
MTIRSLELVRVELPLVRPFRTSFGTEYARDALLVRIETDEAQGWGECVAGNDPLYSSQYVDGALDVIGRFLVPWLLAHERRSGTLVPADCAKVWEPIQGHEMAKGAVEMAVLDAWLRARGESLGSFFGSTSGPVRPEIPCGVSVGIPVDESVESLICEVTAYVDEGYRRIKLKIQPGWDHQAVRAVREGWPDMPLQVDANQAYTRSPEHTAALAALDEFGLLLVEQPLPEWDLLGHVRLAEALATPVCLDESIHSLATCEQALDLGAASIINIKPGRVGGYLEAQRIHDVCLARGVPVWCGGMLETGIGRAANVAIAALPGFTLPGDTSASGRFYTRDVTEPFVLHDGLLTVPTGPGIGVEPLADTLAELTTWRAAVVEDGALV